MTKIDIFSGFLGAGKTTLIKKLINEAYIGEKLVLIENEFGEIGIDGGFLENAGIEITEMNSGCICCSLVGDFGEALKKVIDEYAPDRILIEPSGVGKLSDVKKAVSGVESETVALNGFATVVDAVKCKMYMKNFGEFFNDQIENASAIILSHTDKTDDDNMTLCLKMIREHNENATIVTTPWDMLSGKDILDAIESKNTLSDSIKDIEHEHHHHDEHCDCHEHHHHDEHCDCHEHHHHDEHCDCHEHHHHHADEVFTSWGAETTKRFTKEEITNCLMALSDEEKYGTILRAKGIVAGEGSFIHFDYIPGEPDARDGSASITGRLCVIGSKINEDNLKKLFGIN